MQFCRCEKEAVTIVRYGFWPATPDLPKVAFEIDFMELSTVLQLESQLPIRSFCDALGYMNRCRIHDVKQVRHTYHLASNHFSVFMTLLLSAVFIYYIYTVG